MELSSEIYGQASVRAKGAVAPPPEDRSLGLQVSGTGRFQA